MIKKIKTVILDNRIILENFSFLSVLQVSNLLIFLLTIPYLFRTLGKENYGLVVFAQTIALYFSIIVNFGFNITGTRDISIYRENQNKVNQTISLVLTLKSSLFLMSLLILTLLILLVPLFGNHLEIFYFSMLYCLSEALFPIWYFQGIEKMKYITFLNIGARVGATVAIFMFIKKPDDYIYVPVLLGLGALSGAMIGLYIIFRKHMNEFSLPGISLLRSFMKDNIPLFISNISSQIYANANKIIVGSFLGMQDVAIYDVADKIVNMVKVPVHLVGQTLFPRISRTKDIRFVKNTLILVFIFCLSVYSLIFLFANQIILLFTGNYNAQAATLLRVLSTSILPVSLGIFFAELMLLPFGKLRDYTKMRTSSLFIYLAIISTLIFTKQIGTTQLAITILCVESFVFVYSFILCRKNKII